MVMARKLPLLTQENRAFWQGGERRRTAHLPLRRLPPVDSSADADLPEMRQPERRPRAGVRARTRGQLHHQPSEMVAGTGGPFVIAIVELVEQEGLRFLTNIVGCPPEEVVIGMPVRVTFEQHEDVWLPLFAPDAPEGNA